MNTTRNERRVIGILDVFSKAGVILLAILFAAVVWNAFATSAAERLVSQ